MTSGTLIFCDKAQISPKVLAKSMPSLAATYTCSVMGARGADTNDLRMYLLAVAVSSSRSVSCTGSVSPTAFTAFVWENIELGPALDASFRLLYMDFGEEKETGRADGRLEVPAVTSRLENPDSQGNKHTTTHTTPGGGRNPHSMKPQVGDRSRFRPWGYI